MENLDYILDEVVRVVYSGNKSAGKTEGVKHLLGSASIRGFNVAGIDGDLEEGGLLSNGISRSPPFFFYDDTKWTDLSDEDIYVWLEGGGTEENWMGHLMGAPSMYGPNGEYVPKNRKGLSSKRYISFGKLLQADNPEILLEQAIFRAHLFPEVEEYIQEHINNYFDSKEQHTSFDDQDLRVTREVSTPKFLEEKTNEWLNMKLYDLKLMVEGPKKWINNLLEKAFRQIRDQNLKEKINDSYPMQRLDNYLDLLNKDHSNYSPINEVRFHALESYINGELFDSELQRNELGEISFILSNPADLQAFKDRLDNNPDYAKHKERSNINLAHLLNENYGIEICIEDNELGTHRSALAPVRFNEVDYVLAPLLSDTNAIERFKVLNKFLKNEAGKDKVGFYLARVPTAFDSEKKFWLDAACIKIFDGDIVAESYSYFQDEIVNEFSNLMSEMDSQPAVHYMFMQQYSLSKTLDNINKPTSEITIEEVEKKSKELFGRNIETPYGPFIDCPIPAFNFKHYLDSMALSLQFSKIFDKTMHSIAENRKK